MRTDDEYVEDAMTLINEMGVGRHSSGDWVFTNKQVASFGHIHHSRMPMALAAYAIDPMFAAGKISKYTLVDVVDKIPCTDGVEATALALICGSELPIYPSTEQRAEFFGNTVWSIVHTYQLESCFIEVSRYGSEGRHYTMRPQGFDYDTSTPRPDALKAMRKAYRSMNKVQQIMVLTIIHLYDNRPDKTFLTGGCPTKIPAAEALYILRTDGPALKAWGALTSSYAGW